MKINPQSQNNVSAAFGKDTADKKLGPQKKLGKEAAKVNHELNVSSVILSNDQEVAQEILKILKSNQTTGAILEVRKH